MYNLVLPLVHHYGSNFFARYLHFILCAKVHKFLYSVNLLPLSSYRTVILFSIRSHFLCRSYFLHICLSGLFNDKSTVRQKYLFTKHVFSVLLEIILDFLIRQK